MAQGNHIIPTDWCDSQNNQMFALSKEFKALKAQKAIHIQLKKHFTKASWRCTLVGFFCELCNALN